jgi:hypothetical protein
MNTKDTKDTDLIIDEEGYITKRKKGIRAVLSPTKFADDETKEKQ